VKSFFGSADTSEGTPLEAEFRERRRRVLRAQGAVLVCAVLGLAAVYAARQAAPDAFEAAVAGFVLATFGSILRVWWTARRHWRCPACDVRWQAQDAWASFSWNHCTTCGAPLLAAPVEREREREAARRFEMEAAVRTGDSWRARFEGRRRRSRWAAGLAALAGVGALAWVQARGAGEMLEQSVAAGLVAIVTGTLIWGARCPRCESGTIGEGRHCQRCGLKLAGAEDRGADHPTPHA
jgi:hypothetical protein